MSVTMRTSCEVVSHTEQFPGAEQESVGEQVLYQDASAFRPARIIRLVFLFCLCALFFMFFY
jgi:hypothetical protein